jgi:SAM-dependent methyltransferase
MSWSNKNKFLNNNDLGGSSYWDELWSVTVNHPINLGSYYHYRLDKFFNKFILRNSKVLEIGCGGSQWLPYFAKEYQAEVWGIDYSKTGVDLVRVNLKTQNVNGKIILGDIFTNKDLPNKYFDIVYSYGFIEHFSNPQKVLNRMTQLLNRGGVIITLIPNLQGFIGWLHRIVDADVYNKHVVITPKKLDEAHIDCGLETAKQASYFGIFSIGVVNFNRVRKSFSHTIDRLLWFLIQATQQLVCFPFRLFGIEFESRLLSPYIIGAYKHLYD